MLLMEWIHAAYVGISNFLQHFDHSLGLQVKQLKKFHSPVSFKATQRCYVAKDFPNQSISQQSYCAPKIVVNLSARFLCLYIHIYCKLVVQRSPLVLFWRTEVAYVDKEHSVVLGQLLKLYLKKRMEVLKVNKSLFHCNSTKVLTLIYLSTWSWQRTHMLIVKSRAWSSRCCGLAFVVTLQVGVGNAWRY